MINALTPLIVFVFKVLMYYAALKFRKLDARLMTAAMCAGSTVLVSLIPFPELIHFALTIAIAAFFIVKNADADLYPNGIGIPIVVEIVSAFALSYAVMPLMEML